MNINIKNFNYLKEEINDLNNAIVITNNNFVDYLLYSVNNKIIIRKFPFMYITQIIPFKTLNKFLIIENPKQILFVLLEVKDKLCIKSIPKSQFGNEQSKLIESMDTIN